MPVARFKSALTGELLKVRLSKCDILAILRTYTVKGAKKSLKCPVCLKSWWSSQSDACRKCRLGKQLPVAGMKSRCLEHIPGALLSYKARKYLYQGEQLDAYVPEPDQQVKRLRTFRRWARRAFRLTTKR